MKCGLKVWFGMKDLILDNNAWGYGMTDMPPVLCFVVIDCFCRIQ